MDFGKLALGVGGSILGGLLGQSSAEKARREQLRFLNRSAGEVSRGGTLTRQLLESLRQEMMKGWQNVADESREVGDQQRNIAGAGISAARRRADALVPEAVSGSVMNNLTRGIGNTTASANLTGMLARQAAASGSGLEMQASNIMSDVLGQTFGRTAGILGQRLGVGTQLGAAGAQIPMQVGQQLGQLWGNVQVQPDPAPNMSWLGYMLAQDQKDLDSQSNEDQ